MRPSRRRLTVLCAAMCALAASTLVTTVSAAATVQRCAGKVATIVGTSSGDLLRGTARADVIVGLGGKDRIYAGGGNDIVCAGAGDDLLAAGRGADRMFGGSGADRLLGGAGADVLRGGSGKDLLDAGSGNDQLIAEPRIDGADVMVGGGGNDTASYAARRTAVRVTLNGRSGDGATGEGDNVRSDVENLIGGFAGDRLTGNAAVNTVEGRGGADVVNGGPDDDTLVGGTGNDRLSGDSGDVDLLAGGPGSDQLSGGAGVLDIVAFADAAGGVTASLAAGRASGQGADTLSGLEAVLGSPHDDDLTGGPDLTLLLGWSGGDTLRGAGPGSVTLAAYLLSSRTVAADLLAGVASGEGADTLVELAGVIGSPQGDTLTGGAGADLLMGLAGSDLLFGGGGSDALSGNEGADTLRGGAGSRDMLSGGPGADYLDGGDGDDTVTFAAATTVVIADLSAGTANEGGPDVLNAVENLIGSAGNDTLRGDDGPNRLAGLAGNDHLVGRGDDDQLEGGSGTDSADGGEGDDLCVQVETAVGCVTGGADTALTDGGLARAEGAATAITSVHRRPAGQPASQPPTASEPDQSPGQGEQSLTATGRRGGWQINLAPTCMPSGPFLGVESFPPYMTPAYTDAGGRFPAQRVWWRSSLVELVNGTYTITVPGRWWVGNSVNSANNSGSLLLQYFHNYGLLHFGGQQNFMQPASGASAPLGSGEFIAPRLQGNYYLWFDFHWEANSIWPYTGNDGTYVSMDEFDPVLNYKRGWTWACPIK